MWLMSTVKHMTLSSVTKYSGSFRLAATVLILLTVLETKCTPLKEVANFPQFAVAFFNAGMFLSVLKYIEYHFGLLEDRTIWKRCEYREISSYVPFIKWICSFLCVCFIGRSVWSLRFSAKNRHLKLVLADRKHLLAVTTWTNAFFFTTFLLLVAPLLYRCCAVPFIAFVECIRTLILIVTLMICP